MQVFFFRAGQNWGNRAYFPRHDAEENDAEILSAFIAQFYDDGNRRSSSSSMSSRAMRTCWKKRCA